jgi:hypothetical protein
MRKTVLVFAIVLVAVPALADVQIAVSQGPGPNDVTISYTNNEPGYVCAFALDITIADPCVIIQDVNCVSSDYYVYPGTAQIDPIDGVIVDGTCKCTGYAGTLDEPNAATIEMGCMFIGAANEPAASGDLVILTLAGCDSDIDRDVPDVTVNVSENVIRGGIVMEDPEDDVTVDSPGGAVATALPICGAAAGCWNPVACAGQPYGDATCDGDVGTVNLADLLTLKAAFGECAPWTGIECCADFTHDGCVNLADVLVLKENFGTDGYLPSTGIQTCPE